MATSFKADASLIAKIEDFYSYMKKESNNQLLSFFASNENFSVSIYKTGTVLFQGKDAQSECAIWTNEKNNYIDHIGSDEVGCGDFFGPVVVCATLVKKENYESLLKLGIKDSKQLSDDKIKIIAPEIKKMIPNCIFILTNKKYNEIREKDYNLNKIKAYLHNYVLYNLVKKTNFKGQIIMDQFAPENLYYSYLNDYKDKVQKNIYFTTKAENKYLAVACASIIARYTFLEQIEKMENEINEKIPLGASAIVDEFAYKLALKIGLENMKNYVKWHFKNTNYIIDKINK